MRFCVQESAANFTPFYLCMNSFLKIELFYRYCRRYGRALYFVHALYFVRPLYNVYITNQFQTTFAGGGGGGGVKS
jgi:hypothetical protein